MGNAGFISETIVFVVVVSQVQEQLEQRWQQQQEHTALKSAVAASCRALMRPDSICP